MKGGKNMKTISIINLKGGVAKTITSINMAHILSSVYGKKVLLIDNDKQGNTSKFFRLHSYDHKSIADVLVERNFNVYDVIRKTEYENLDLISANMNLLSANLKVIMDMSRQQQTILRKALERVKDQYDFCIIDNAPDINISVINALVTSDEIIVPIKVDKFSFDGLDQLIEQFEEVKELNPSLIFKGCLITSFVKNDVNVQGEYYLNSQDQYPMFGTHIRRTEKIDESTFVSQPIAEYSRQCGAAKDYINFMKEYLGE